MSSIELIRTPIASPAPSAPAPAAGSDGSNAPQAATQSNSFAPVSADQIMNSANTWKNHSPYGLSAINKDMGAGQAKDHQWVGDTLTQAGTGSFDTPQTRPSIADWADKNADIPGWNVVDGPARKGDVLAMAKPNNPVFGMRLGQMGIATGDGTSIGMPMGGDIMEGDIGLADGDNATIRRYANLADGDDVA